MGLFKSSRRKIEEKTAASWGKIKEKRRNFDLISRYTTIGTGSDFHQLTDQTLSDIDIEDLFSCIDRTETGIGQQVLFHTLLHPTNNVEALKKTHRLSDHLLSNPQIRKNIQYYLYRLEQGGTYFIVDLFAPKREPAKENPAYKTLALAAATLTVLSFFVHSLISLLIVLFFVNILIHFIHRNKSQNRIQTVSEAFSTIAAARKLAEMNLPVADQAAVKEAIQKLSSINRLFRFLGAPTPSDDLSIIVLLVFELLKGFFLIEPLALNRCYKLALHNEAAFKTLYQFIGAVDLALSKASLRSDSTYRSCTPEFTDKEKALHFSNAYHPLVTDAVSNSFRAQGQHIFITGSNMSGKSTFLRTVLINSILAQTLYFCFAEHFITNIYKQYSAIKISDNLFEQESYFYKELEVIRTMVQQSEAPSNHLFFIDEIYKGTNTTERMALALSVLQYLNREKDLVIASSHDLELVTFLKGSYKMYHFSESIHNDQLVFDYYIKEGAVQSRNAIKLAAIEKYPPPVIEQAMEYTKLFNTKDL